jgi:hypothetical protein
MNRAASLDDQSLNRGLVVGLISVVAIIAGLLAAAIYLVHKGARRWWDYLTVVGLTVLLVRPLLDTVTGDISAWLPNGIWSDGFDGKGEIIIASVASSILIPLVLAAGTVYGVRRLIDCSRANRVGSQR